MAPWCGPGEGYPLAGIKTYPEEDADDPVGEVAPEDAPFVWLVWIVDVGHELLDHGAWSVVAVGKERDRAREDDKLNRGLGVLRSQERERASNASRADRRSHPAPPLLRLGLDLSLLLIQ